MLNRKGFTLIELISVIVILSLVLLLATFALTAYLHQGRDKSFDVAVNSFEDAVLEAYTDCNRDRNSSSFCLTNEIPDYNQEKTVYLKDLISSYYIDPIKNPYNTKEKCDGESYVVVTNTDKTGISLEYQTCLICGEHRSDGC